MCIRDSLVYRPEQNRRRRSAPNLHYDPCGSSAGCDLVCHTCGTSTPWPTVFSLGAPLSARHVNPLADCFFSWRTSERAAHPLRPSCRAISTRIHVSRKDSCLALLGRPPASQSVFHCCTLQVRLTLRSGLICCNYSSGPIPPPNSSNRVPRNI